MSPRHFTGPFQRAGVRRKSCLVVARPRTSRFVQRLILPRIEFPVHDDLEDLIQDINQTRARLQPANTDCSRRPENVRVEHVRRSQPREYFRCRRAPQVVVGEENSNDEQSPGTTRPSRSWITPWQRNSAMYCCGGAPATGISLRMSLFAASVRPSVCWRSRNFVNTLSVMAPFSNCPARNSKPGSADPRRSRPHLGGPVTKAAWQVDSA